MVRIRSLFEEFVDWRGLDSCGGVLLAGEWRVARQEGAGGRAAGVGFL